MVPLPEGVTEVSEVAATIPWRDTVNAFKRRLVEHALAVTGGNRTTAARILGVHRPYLLHLIRDLGVDAPPPARGRRAPQGQRGLVASPRSDRMTPLVGLHTTSCARGLQRG